MAPTRDRLTRLLRGARRAVLRRRRLLAALLAALAVASGIHAVAAPPPARVPVLVAAHDLSSGSVVAPDDLVEVAFAPGSVPDGLAEDPVGRILAAPLRRGEPVTDLRLVGAGLTDGHPGLTALPVRLPDAGMVDLLRVGDRVDLVATDPQGAGTQTVAVGVPVLAIPRVAPDATGSGLPGRLVVVGAPPASVSRIADAVVRRFVVVAFSR